MLRKNTAGQFVGFAGVNASTGAAMTGTTGFAAYRCLDGAAQVAATGTVTDKGNGQYSFALSQADTNGNDCSILFTMTGMVPVEKTIVTTACDPTDSVRFGLTGIPAAAAGAVGGLPLSVDTSGRVDALKINGTSQTARDLGASVLLSVGTGMGQVNLASGKVPATLASTDVTGNVAADLQTIKTQVVTCAAGVTIPTSIASPTNITAAAGVVLADASLTTAKLGTFVLAKTTNITGFNDIAASAVVSGGAIATSAGVVVAVSTVTVTGSVTGSVVGDVQGKVLGGGASAITGDGVRAASVTGNVGGNVTGTVTLATNQTFNNTGTWTGNLTGTVGSVTGAVGSVTASVTVGGYSAGQDPATLVLDVAATNHNTASSMGAKINAAGAAADPLSNSVPGVYVQGTAGYALGHLVVKLASDGLDAVTVEAGINARQALALIGAATAAKSSGLDTPTATFYAMGLTGTTTARIVAATNAGNRNSIVLTPPA